jgi:Tol biopolymer transport system component
MPILRSGLPTASKLPLSAVTIKVASI